MNIMLIIITIMIMIMIMIMNTITITSILAIINKFFGARALCRQTR